MRASVPFLALAFAACASSENPTAQTAAAEEVPAALMGEVIGKPVSCLTSRNIEHIDAVTDRVVLIRMRGGGVYRAEPQPSCPRLSRAGTALTYKTTSNQLCNIDPVTVFDPVSGIFYGTCTLGAFTPYRLPEGVRP